MLSFKKGKKNIGNKKGFTLLEMLVSMTLFSFVVTIALGALFSIMKANEKTKVIKLVVNNLNMALEGMTREIRVGYDYDYELNNCSSSSGCKKFTFKTKDGCEAYYEYNEVDKTIEREILKKKPGDGPGVCTGGEVSAVRIVGSDIDIEKLRFVTVGNSTSDGQPRVLINLKGEIGNVMLENPEVFNIQTTISQRRIDPS